MSTQNPPLLIVGNHLSSAGFNPGVGEELANRLRQASWPALTTSAKPGKIFRVADMMTTAWRARRRYALAQVDVFSGNAFAWAEAVTEVLKLAQKPYVLTLHGGGLPEFSLHWPRRVSRLLQPAAAVTGPSPYLLERMRRFRRDLLLVPNPLDVSVCPYVPRRRVRPRLVWLRAFHEIYNPALAVSVLALLRRQAPDVQLTMIGPDHRDGSLLRTKHRAQCLDVSRSLTLRGRIPKSSVPFRLNEADIFLNTANVDNAPVSVLEAMACGLCIVSTNVGGIPFFLKHGENALLTPPRDAEAMAQAVLRIFSEPGLAGRLSRNARGAAERFDWASVLPQWEHLLRSTARGLR